MATSVTVSKGTRKTYSFEEREILVNLIAKHLNSSNESEEDKSLESNALATPTTSSASAAVVGGSGTSAPKRKSAWSQLTEEYNSLVGPENTRSTIQLRRCWENMKANKKNRDDKRDHRASDKSAQDAALQLPLPSALGLPPNVVFQPKESESFAYEGLVLPTFRCNEVKQEYDFNDDIEDRPDNDSESLLMDESPCLDSSLEPPPMKKQKRKTSSPKKQQQIKQKKIPKLSKVQKNNDLFEYSLSEAQLKLETAALVKEEAKLKLEEAEYRKEEARMRMICATYELQRTREECEDAAGAAAADGDGN